MLPQQTLINPQLVRQKHGYHPLKNFLMPIVHIPLLLSFVVAWRLIVLEFPNDPSLLNGYSFSRVGVRALVFFFAQS